MSDPAAHDRLDNNSAQPPTPQMAHWAPLINPPPILDFSDSPALRDLRTYSTRGKVLVAIAAVSLTALVSFLLVGGPSGVRRASQGSVPATTSLSTAFMLAVESENFARAGTFVCPGQRLPENPASLRRVVDERFGTGGLMRYREISRSVSASGASTRVEGTVVIFGETTNVIIWLANQRTGECVFDVMATDLERP